MNYQIFIDKEAQKEIEKFVSKAQRRISKNIDKLALNPRPGGKNFRPLTTFTFPILKIQKVYDGVGQYLTSASFF